MVVIYPPSNISKILNSKGASFNNETHQWEVHGEMTSYLVQFEKENVQFLFSKLFHPSVKKDIHFGIGYSYFDKLYYISKKRLNEFYTHPYVIYQAAQFIKNFIFTRIIVLRKKYNFNKNKIGIYSTIIGKYFINESKIDNYKDKKKASIIIISYIKKYILMKKSAIRISSFYRGWSTRKLLQDERNKRILLAKQYKDKSKLEIFLKNDEHTNFVELYKNHLVINSGVTLEQLYLFLNENKMFEYDNFSLDRVFGCLCCLEDKFENEFVPNTCCPNTICRSCFRNIIITTMKDPLSKMTNIMNCNKCFSPYRISNNYLIKNKLPAFNNTLWHTMFKIISHYIIGNQTFLQNDELLYLFETSPRNLIGKFVLKKFSDSIGWEIGIIFSERMKVEANMYSNIFEINSSIQEYDNTEKYYIVFENMMRKEYSNMEKLITSPHIKILISSIDISYQNLLNHIRKMEIIKCKSCRNIEILGEKKQLNCNQEEVYESFTCLKCSNNTIRQCPACMIFIERIDGCNIMKCSCKISFCYCCSELLNEENIKSHYQMDSFSPCKNM